MTLITVILMITVNPRISPRGLSFLWFFAQGKFEGGLFDGSYKKFFLVVRHIPVDIFLLVNCFYDATRTSNKTFLKDRHIPVN